MPLGVLEGFLVSITERGTSGYFIKDTVFVGRDSDSGNNQKIS